MKKSIYHVGIGKQNNGLTMVIEARKNIDCLSCEIYDYMGKRETTKKSLNAKRYELLKWMQIKRPDVYNDCKFAIVD